MANLGFPQILSRLTHVEDALNTILEYGISQNGVIDLSPDLMTIRTNIGKLQTSLTNEINSTNTDIINIQTTLTQIKSIVDNLKELQTEDDTVSIPNILVTVAGLKTSITNVENSLFLNGQKDQTQDNRLTQIENFLSQTGQSSDDFVSNIKALVDKIKSIKSLYDTLNTAYNTYVSSANTQNINQDTQIQANTSSLNSITPRVTSLETRTGSIETRLTNNESLDVIQTNRLNSLDASQLIQDGKITTNSGLITTIQTELGVISGIASSAMSLSTSNSASIGFLTLGLSALGLSSLFGNSTSSDGTEVSNNTLGDIPTKIKTLENSDISQNNRLTGIDSTIVELRTLITNSADNSTIDSIILKNNEQDQSLTTLSSDVTNLKGKYNAQGLLPLTNLQKGSNYTILRQDASGNLAYGNIDFNYILGNLPLNKFPLPTNASNSNGMVLAHYYTPQTYSSSFSYGYIGNNNIQDGSISGNKISTFLSSKIQWDVADTGTINIFSADPTQSRHLATKNYVDKATTNSILPVGTFTSNASNDLTVYWAGNTQTNGNVNAYRISSVGAPINNNDVATKIYTDNANNNTLNSAKAYSDSKTINSLPIDKIGQSTVTTNTVVSTWGLDLPPEQAYQFRLIFGQNTFNTREYARIRYNLTGDALTYNYGSTVLHLGGYMNGVSWPLSDGDTSNKIYVDKKLPPNSYVDSSGNLRIGGDSNRIHTIYNLRDPSFSWGDAMNLGYFLMKTQCSMDNTLIAKTDIENPPFRQYLICNLNCTQICYFNTSSFFSPNIKIRGWLNSSGNNQNHFLTNATSTVNQPILCTDGSPPNGLRAVYFDGKCPLGCSTLSYVTSANPPSYCGIYSSTIFMAVSFNSLMKMHSLWSSDTGFSNGGPRVDSRQNNSTIDAGIFGLGIFSGNNVKLMYHPTGGSLIQPKLNKWYVFCVIKQSYYSVNTGKWNELVPSDQGASYRTHYQVYLDRTMVFNQANSEATTNTAKNDMTLAGLQVNDVNNAENFSGHIHSMLIYNRPLSAEERTIIWDMYKNIGMPLSYTGGQFSL